MPQQPMRQSDPTQGDVALFNEVGTYVTTVKLPLGVRPDVIGWGGRMFSWRNGSYREAYFWASDEAQR